MIAASTWARRAGAVLVALAVAVVVTLLVVPRTAPDPTEEPTDSDVLVSDVSVRQTDPSYTVESVHAVVQQDEAFLRVRITWPDDPRDGATVHLTPSLSGTVTHRDPSSSLTATCGADTGMVRPVRSGPDGIDLICSGVLLPEAVASVELSD